MRHTTFVAVAALGAFLSGLHELGHDGPTQQDALAPAAAAGVDWRTDLAGATREAKRDKRPLLVVFR